jgi:hypothetical protein
LKPGGYKLWAKCAVSNLYSSPATAKMRGVTRTRRGAAADAAAAAAADDDEDEDDDERLLAKEVLVLAKEVV